MGMTLGDTARVLALAQLFDNRKVDELVVASWHGLIGNLGFEDSCAAVNAHYARTREWIMPVDILDGVKRLRADRLARTVDPVPAVDPDQPREFAEAVRETRRAIADGTTPQPETLRLEGNRGLPDGFVKTFQSVRENNRRLIDAGDPVAVAAEAERRANEEREAREEIRRLHEEQGATANGSPS